MQVMQTGMGECHRLARVGAALCRGDGSATSFSSSFNRSAHFAGLFAFVMMSGWIKVCASVVGCSLLAVRFWL